MTERENQTRLPADDTGRMLREGIRPDTIPAIVMMVFIILMNSCVILLISRHSYLKTTSNLILASLALSDFLMGLVGIPLVTACSATLQTPICLSSVIFTTFISLTTAANIAIMTCDRYIYILCALRYHEIITRARVVTVLCITWFTSLVVSMVRLSWTVNVQIANAREDLALVKEKEMIYFSFNFVAFFFIPLVLMVVLDVRMLLVLRRQYQRITRENVPAAFVAGKRERKLRRRQKRAVLTCILLLILYVVFWLPYFIMEFVQQATDTPLGLSYAAALTIYYLRFCTSLVNPFIYTLRKHDLKRTVKSIIRKVLRRPNLLEYGTEEVQLSSRGTQ